ncbi:MAG TPA: thioredoxin domain-containing protein [Thermoanaerobaculia bacterium]|nr:thioredoxin domain-containing protein [Thermoanaerobaculia bacterium]
MKQEHPPTVTGRRTLLLLVTGVLLLAFGWILSGESVEAKADPKKAEAAADGPVAVIQGEPVTRAELELAAADKLEQLDVQRLQFEVRHNQERQQALLDALDSLVEQRLLELEAAARGTTAEALSAEIPTPEVTDADIDAFYIQLQQQRPQGLPAKERIVDQIRGHLTQQKQLEAREAFFAELRGKYAVETYLQTPRVEVVADGHPARGPADAPVTLVEFSDFQCPFCARVVPTLDQIHESYGDKVRIVFRQFPLNIHPQAQKAAEASLCAHDQGKFWEMHDLMFEEQKTLSVPDLKAKAERLGLDTATFAQCLESGKYEEQVAADLKAGAVIGVSGTPAVFINGRFLSGAQPYEAFAEIIDDELARQSQASAKGR